MLKDLKIFSQNVRKNNIIVNTILKVNHDFNIIFIFNTALHHSIDISILDEIDSISSLPWNPFSKEEFKIAISSCNNSSSPGLDKLSWSDLKLILQNNECLINVIKITILRP